MGGLLCTCGNSMRSTECPAPDMIHVWIQSLVKAEQSRNPGLSAWDLDEPQEKFTAGLGFWFCNACRRVTAVSAETGRTRFTWKPAGNLAPPRDTPRWKRLWCMSDLELCDYEEEFCNSSSDAPPARDLLDMYAAEYLVSPDLRRVCIRREDGTYCVTHVLERIWPVREERIRKEFPENVRRIETYI